MAETMKKVRTIIRVHCRGTTDNPHTLDTKKIPHKINIDLMKWNWPTLADSQTINKRLSETPKIEIPMTRRRGPDTRAKSYCFIKTQSTWLLCQESHRTTLQKNLKRKEHPIIDYKELGTNNVNATASRQEC